MPKFVFFTGISLGGDSPGYAVDKPNIRVFDVDTIEALIGNEHPQRIINSADPAYYAYVASTDGRTLKGELENLGACFLTDANSSPIPPAQAKYVFLEAEFNGQHAWINLAKVKGFTFGFSSAVIGSRTYEIPNMNVERVLTATGLGAIIAINV